MESIPAELLPSTRYDSIGSAKRWIQVQVRGPREGDPAFGPSNPSVDACSFVMAVHGSKLAIFISAGGADAADEAGALSAGLGVPDMGPPQPAATSTRPAAKPALKSLTSEP